MADLPGPLWRGLCTSSSMPTRAETSPRIWGLTSLFIPLPLENTDHEVTLPQDLGTYVSPYRYEGIRTLLSPAHTTGQKLYRTSISSGKTPEPLLGQ